MDNNPFVIEKSYPVSIEKVWKAITDPTQMKVWYFDLPGFSPTVGYEFEFMGGSPDGEQFRHICRVTEVIPNRKLSYTWRYDGFPGESLVSFELFSEGEQATRLRLTHKGLETFPADNPNLARNNFVMGWTEIIGKSLVDFLKA